MNKKSYMDYYSIQSAVILDNLRLLALHQKMQVLSQKLGNESTQCIITSLR